MSINLNVVSIYTWYMSNLQIGSPISIVLILFLLLKTFQGHQYKFRTVTRRSAAGKVEASQSAVEILRVCRQSGALPENISWVFKLDAFEVRAKPITLALLNAVQHAWATGYQTPVLHIQGAGNACNISFVKLFLT